MPARLVNSSARQNEAWLRQEDAVLKEESKQFHAERARLLADKKAFETERARLMDTSEQILEKDNATALLMAEEISALRRRVAELEACQAVPEEQADRGNLVDTHSPNVAERAAAAAAQTYAAVEEARLKARANAAVQIARMEAQLAEMRKQRDAALHAAAGQSCGMSDVIKCLAAVLPDCCCRSEDTEAAARGRANTDSSSTIRAAATLAVSGQENRAVTVQPASLPPTHGSPRKQFTVQVTTI